MKEKLGQCELPRQKVIPLAEEGHQDNSPVDAQSGSALLLTANMVDVLGLSLSPSSQVVNHWLCHQGHHIANHVGH